MTRHTHSERGDVDTNRKRERERGSLSCPHSTQYTHALYTRATLRYVPAMPAGERVTGAEGMTKAWAARSKLEPARAATKKVVRPCMAEG